MKSIYDMMGKYTYPTMQDDAPREHVESFFQVQPGLKILISLCLMIAPNCRNMTERVIVLVKKVMYRVLKCAAVVSSINKRLPFFIPENGQE